MNFVIFIQKLLIVFIIIGQIYSDNSTVINGKESSNTDQIETKTLSANLTTISTKNNEVNNSIAQQNSNEDQTHPSTAVYYPSIVLYEKNSNDPQFSKGSEIIYENSSNKEINLDDYLLLFNRNQQPLEQNHFEEESEDEEINENDDEESFANDNGEKIVNIIKVKRRKFSSLTPPPETILYRGKIFRLYKPINNQMIHHQRKHHLSTIQVPIVQAESINDGERRKHIAYNKFNYPEISYSLKQGIPWKY